MPGDQVILEKTKRFYQLDANISGTVKNKILIVISCFELFYLYRRGGEGLLKTCFVILLNRFRRKGEKT